MQVEAHRHGGVGIDGAIAAFDMANDAVLIDDNVRAESPLVALALHIVGLQDSVAREHLAVHIAEEGEFDADLFRESRVRSGTIHAYAENFRVVRVQLAGVDSRLDRLELLRSTTGEGQDVDREENIFLSAEIAQLYRFPLVAE